MPDHAVEYESVEQFRIRLRRWLPENLPRLTPGHVAASRDSDELWTRARELQATIHSGGFAGICFPREYGGLGLGYEYQRAFDSESAGYELPVCLNLPSFAICCATILDTGAEEQKRKHIGAALRGEQVLVQLLSEPGGGSDLAGVTTRAERRDGRWILNGAKTWSTCAFAADYGLCLVRTDPTVPKHDGLTMFIVPIKHPGVTLRRIEQVNGSLEFCEEFFDDVELGDDAVLGEVGQGWAVVSRQLFHERLSLGNGSQYSSGTGSESPEDSPLDLVHIVETSTGADDRDVRRAAGRALVHRYVARQLTERVFSGMQDGSVPPSYGTILRLVAAETNELELDTALMIADSAATVDAGDGLCDIGTRFLGRQVLSIGGGTTEIARNIIAERILEFPREYAADRGVPFNQVRHND